MVVSNSHRSKSLQPVLNCSGFTLVELLVVVAILGILASVAISGFSDFKDKVNIAKTAAEIRGIEKDIFAYAAERGNFPPTLAPIGWGTRLDPWGNAYVYEPPETRLLIRLFGGLPINTDFDLYSKGPDKATSANIVDNDDDIIRAGDGGFVGTAEKYGP